MFWSKACCNELWYLILSQCGESFKEFLRLTALKSKLKLRLHTAQSKGKHKGIIFYTEMLICLILPNECKCRL